MRCPSLNTKRFVGAFIGLLALCAASASFAGSLQFYETRVSPGQLAVLGTPATNAPIDLNVRPQSAEGGGFYGFSEFTLWATGDLTIEAGGLGCQATSCLYSPLPFVPGMLLAATGGDDLGGDFTWDTDVLTFSVSGTNGYIVIAAGEYIDATGPGGDPGEPQTITVAPLVRVPEPSLFGMLVPGCLLLAGASLAKRREHS